MPTNSLTYRHALLLLLLLDDAGEDPGATAALVTESDITQCGHTEAVYTNHTTSAKSVHVKVKNECFGRDILNTDSARVWVRDAQGGVVNHPDVKIPHDGSHRGTFSVPGGGDPADRVFGAVVTG